MLGTLVGVGLAVAGANEESFDTDGGAWGGGTAGNGVLTIVNGAASLDLGDAGSLSGTMRLRLVSGERLSLGLGQATWTADYRQGGGITLGAESATFPSTHLGWVPDDSFTITVGPEDWDGRNVLHCDVVQAPDDTWYLYWTGEVGGEGYGFRTIGVATSSDHDRWREYSGNPVVTLGDELSDVDGVHVHQPTVVIDATETWHLYYACYENNVGNRLCHASSADGLAWEKHGVVLDKGDVGTFDEGSLREPEAWIGDDGTWHMVYNGTDPDAHYGATGYATSPDGWTWTKLGAITEDESRLQGGGVLRTAYGLEQWWNCEDRFCHSWADPLDPTTWYDTGETMPKTAVPGSFGGGYIQAPSPAVDGTALHLWFNAFGDDGEGHTHERLWHAEAIPAPGAWLTVHLDWDGTTLSTTWTDDNGMQAQLATGLDAATELLVTATGLAEIDSASFTWEAAPPDTGTDSGAPDTAEEGADSGPDSGENAPSDAAPAAAPGSCGCAAGAGAGGPLLLLATALASTRRRRPRSA